MLTGFPAGHIACWDLGGEEVGPPGAVSGVRDREWDNIACVHRQQGLATTWSFGDSKMGEFHLLHERFKQDMALRNAVATCLCFTSCGNFVLLGYSS
jgi:hypothetical protein